jgi:hypothetical protein
MTMKFTRRILSEDPGVVLHSCYVVFEVKQTFSLDETFEL